MDESSPVVMLFQLVVLAVLLIPMANIVKRAGYSPWLTLLGIVPLVNFVMFLVFAFSTWPRQRAQSAVAETFE
jgi:hypothetical protein